MCLPFHKTVARLWKIKWVGFITENLVQWLPSSKATAKHRCNSVQETAHRFPSSFWAGLAIQPAYPAEALHPIDLHGQQSLLAHAIGGLGQIGGVTTAPHIRWNKRSPGPTGRLYLCITCSLACHSSVCLHSTQCVHTLLLHGTDHVTEVIASVWPKATQCTGQENMKGLKTVGQDHASRGSTRPCFATDQASGRGGPVCGNCSFLDHLDPAYPSLPCKCPTNCPQVTLIHRPSSPQRWVNL